MIINNIYITDYIKNPDIEKEIIKKKLLSEKNKFKATVLLVWHKNCDREYLKNFKKLKLIVRYGVGVDNIDLNYCKKKKIKVANTPDYGISEVSDTSLAMIMYFIRRIGDYNSRIQKSFGGWQLETIKYIKRSETLNIGIIGFGRIGKILSKKLNFIGFNCYYFDPFLKHNKRIKYASKINNLNKLLNISDVISINCTLTNSSKGMVNTSFLKKIKKNCILVNTSRGQVIDNLKILYKHMSRNKNFYLGLDVLPEEPPSLKDPLIKRWKSKKFEGRIIINPHTAYYSQESYISMRKKASENVLLFLKKKRVRNRIV